MEKQNIGRKKIKESFAHDFKVCFVNFFWIKVCCTIWFKKTSINYVFLFFFMELFSDVF